MNPRPVNVLIVRLSAIGDVVQGIPALVALKETFPAWRICWLVEETSAPVLEGHPHLSRLYVLKRGWRKRGLSASGLREGTGDMRSVLDALRRERFDAAVDLQGLFKSGLWTWLSGAPRRIGHGDTREFADLFLNEIIGRRPVFDPDHPLVERYLEAAVHLGADPGRARYVLPPARDGIRERVDRLLAGGDPGKPLVALCPCSNWRTKDWPVGRWAELASKLQPAARLLLIGAGKDAETISGIAGSAPSAVNLTGRTSLGELMEIFRRCRIVIGGDSGPAHLANAAGVARVVMIFGSTGYRRSGPWGAGHSAISRELSCQPCFERVCPLRHMNCLGDIGVDEVHASVARALGR